MLLVAGFVFGLAPACSKHDEAAPTVVVGATVGTVIEIGGKVTATRAGQARDLKAGSEVSADDKIATGDDSRVTIELAHNSAHWALGANRSGVVSESVAWTLPKATGPAGTVEGDMSAGGRHMEKSSTETAESTATKAKQLEQPLGGASDPATQQKLAEELAKAQKAQKPAAPKLQPPPKHAKHDTLDDLMNDSGPHEIGASGGGEDAEDPKAAARATGFKLQIALGACIAEGQRLQIKVKCTARACVMVPDASIDATVAKCIAGKIGAIKADTAITFTMPLVLQR